MDRRFVAVEDTRSQGKLVRARVPIRPGTEIVRRERSEFCWPCDLASARDWAERHTGTGGVQVLRRIDAASRALGLPADDLLPAAAYLEASASSPGGRVEIHGAYAVPTESGGGGSADFVREARDLAARIAKAVAENGGGKDDGVVVDVIPDVDEDALARFMLMVWTNALSTDVCGGGVVTAAHPAELRYGALFPGFSKISHSCRPNAMGSAEITFDLWDEGEHPDPDQQQDDGGNGDGDGDGDGSVAAADSLVKSQQPSYHGGGGAHLQDDERDRREATRPRVVLVTVRALETIEDGEVISVSYLAPLDLCLPAADRGRMLEGGKFFSCTCSRCTGADMCNVLPCPSCRGPCVRTAWAAREGIDPWRCKHCDAEHSDASVVTESRRNALAEIGSAIEELRLSLRTQTFRGEAIPITLLPRIIEPLAARSRAELGINHAYTNLCGHYLPSVFYSSVADPHRASDEMVEFIEWLESHVEDTCPSAGLRLTLGCFEELCACGRDGKAREVVRHRIPLMRAAFGPYDEGVRAATRFVLEAAEAAKNNNDESDSKAMVAM